MLVKIIKKIWARIKHFAGFTEKTQKETIAKEWLSFGPRVIDTDPKIDSYVNMLREGINKNDVYNVAITGTFGAGKSTLINTYLNRTKGMRKRSIKISLAHFNNLNRLEGQFSNGTQGLLNNSNKIEEMLERKIYNQLVHQINYKKIPQISGRPINRRSNRWSYSISSVLVTYVLFFTFLVIHHIDFVKFNVNSLLNQELSTVKLSLLFLLYFLSVCVLTYEIISRISNHHFNISIGGIATEIDGKGGEGEQENSYFDRYLHEIIYILTFSDIELLIFEDLDRFKYHSIFEKLREINILANKVREQKNKKKLVFLYAVKDDLFTSRNDTNDSFECLDDEKTKFFDFIVPILPVSNRYNSDSYFSNFLDTYVRELDKNFLSDISKYVYDLRMIQHICNEFHLFLNIFKLGQDSTQIKLDYNKALSIIVLKNMYTKEFLQYFNNQGDLYDKLNDPNTQSDSDSLLDYLITNSLLDESYLEYFNYPDAPVDISFVRLVRGGKKYTKELDSFSLTDIPNILSRLKEEDYDSSSICHENILNYAFSADYESLCRILVKKSEDNVHQLRHVGGVHRYFSKMKKGNKTESIEQIEQNICRILENVTLPGWQKICLAFLFNENLLVYLLEVENISFVPFDEEKKSVFGYLNDCCTDFEIDYDIVIKNLQILSSYADHKENTLGRESKKFDRIGFSEIKNTEDHTKDEILSRIVEGGLFFFSEENFLDYLKAIGKDETWNSYYQKIYDHEKMRKLIDMNFPEFFELFKMSVSTTSTFYLTEDRVQANHLLKLDNKGDINKLKTYLPIFK
ncbi:TPA: ATP-binding protein [Streptococcus suis]